jgi:hypothetical protein
MTPYGSGSLRFHVLISFFFLICVCPSTRLSCERTKITSLAYYRQYITSEVVAALLNNLEMYRRNSRKLIKNSEPHWPQSSALWATVACKLPSSGISTLAASLRGLLYAPCLKTWRPARLTSRTSLLSEIPLPPESLFGVWTLLV